MSFRGEDYEVRTAITIEQAYRGTLIDLNLSMPEPDAEGRVLRVPKSLQVRVPKGATDGQRMRLAGKGGRGINGGPDGDLYLTIALLPHRLYRADGHDLHLDLPLAPWEAALGASVGRVPTPGGPVQMENTGRHCGGPDAAACRSRAAASQGRQRQLVCARQNRHAQDHQ